MEFSWNGNYSIYENRKRKQRQIRIDKNRKKTEEMSSDLAKVCAKYNMIDTKKVVDGCKANPGSECKKLKEICHDALRQGKSNVNKGAMSQANSNFAMAYQARCLSDYIWVNILKEKGDATHAEFLISSRDFGAYCTDGLSGKAKQDALKMINNLK